MGLFDALQNLIGGATDIAQGSIGDVVGNVTDIVPGQEILDQVTGLTEDAAGAVTEGKTAVEDITQNLGL